MQHATQSASLADILERVLDKGVVVAGDISISLVGVELLTIRVRLLIASVDKAREIGIDWWEHDPALSSRARALEAENQLLRERLERLERIALPTATAIPGEAAS
ncbi:MAG: gas vesicle protein [Roseiflexaceae bacterium]